jgi:hypothetical protein
MIRMLTVFIATLVLWLVVAENCSLKADGLVFMTVLLLLFGWGAAEAARQESGVLMAGPH